MTGSTAEDLWVQWWCNPWHWAHPAWQNRFAQAHGLSIDVCTALLNSRHAVFLHTMGIEPSQPPPPDEATLRWLSLTPSQRDHALALAQCICFAPGERDDPEGQWCRALTKALRPSVWLMPETADARALLGAWLGPACWSRLRLAWAPGEVADNPSQAPDGKLQTLWQAILWRVTAG
ncbi:type III secretion protein [Pseudomonas asturiensis]|uniref:Type III secretion protein n=1 Tax=Pseudomonas asturiensis TaxID=1190415 RepID=A0ABX6H983_9PSED|nr:type III secretion protein [Pseudomonas asturiensis]QHF02092.1 type III secretion protein [Pseudomonas asturiensis]